MSNAQSPHDAAHVVEQKRTAAASDACLDVTRLVVVKDNHPAEYWADAWRISVQDGGRTIKLFAAGDGSGPAAARVAESAAALLGFSEGATRRFVQEIAEAGRAEEKP